MRGRGRLTALAHGRKSGLRRGEDRARLLERAGQLKSRAHPSGKPHWGPAIPDLPYSAAIYKITPKCQPLARLRLTRKGARAQDPRVKASFAAAALLPSDWYSYYDVLSTGKKALQTVFLIIVLVSMPGQGPVLMIQILRSMKLLHASRISFPPLFPELLAMM